MRVFIGIVILLSIQACTPFAADTITTFTTLNVNDNHGRSKIIEQQHQKWRLINVWATWCGPCREEMPALENLSKNLTQQLDVLILSIDEDNNLVKEFLHKYQITIPSYIAPQSLVEQQLLITQYPTTLLVSPQGLVVEIYIGSRDWNSPLIIEKMEQHFG